MDPALGTLNERPGTVGGKPLAEFLVDVTGHRSRDSDGLVGKTPVEYAMIRGHAEHRRP